MYTQQHCYVFPKNIIPWRDSNPGLQVPEADAMSSEAGLCYVHDFGQKALFLKTNIMVMFLCIDGCNFSQIANIFWKMVAHVFVYRNADKRGHVAMIFGDILT
jgi:hypothetical protein